MEKILVFLEYYIPGYKSGGPLQTIKNIVDILGEDVYFSIVTRDRDVGDPKPYEGVNVDVWCDLGRARVLYLSPERITLSKMKALMQEKDYDTIYLNSFFSFRFSILPMIVHRTIRPKGNLLIAPRGEFSPGALSIKPLKKRMYISVSKSFSLFKYSAFHASTDMERYDIEAVMSPDVTIRIAKDLPDVSTPDLRKLADNISEYEAIRVCFISRLVSKKNLDYAISVLKLCKSSIEFTVFGSKENPAYWNRCQQLLDELPANVSWEYSGDLHPSEVKATFARFDVFLFPTRGENYGHVIAESLLSGTYALISDQTPWVGLKDAGLGCAIPLSQKFEFVREIEAWSLLTPQERFEKKLEIQKNANEFVIKDQDVEDNRILFGG